MAKLERCRICQRPLGFVLDHPEAVSFYCSLRCYEGNHVGPVHAIVLDPWLARALHDLRRAQAEGGRAWSDAKHNLVSVALGVAEGMGL